MRVIPLMAGLAIAMAACGGEQKTEDQQTMTPEQAAPVGEAPAATGTTHDVNMVLEGSTYKYVPSELSIKPGDVVRFHNVSGPPHNVSFWADSIPAGGARYPAPGASAITTTMATAAAPAACRHRFGPRPETMAATATIRSGAALATTPCWAATVTTRSRARSETTRSMAVRAMTT